MLRVMCDHLVLRGCLLTPQCSCRRIVADRRHSFGSDCQASTDFYELIIHQYQRLHIGLHTFSHRRITLVGTFQLHNLCYIGHELSY